LRVLLVLLLCGAPACDLSGPGFDSSRHNWPAQVRVELHRLKNVRLRNAASCALKHIFRSLDGTQRLAFIDQVRPAFLVEWNRTQAPNACFVWLYDHLQPPQAVSNLRRLGQNALQHIWPQSHVAAVIALSRRRAARPREVLYGWMISEITGHGSTAVLKDAVKRMDRTAALRVLTAVLSGNAPKLFAFLSGIGLSSTAARHHLLRSTAQLDILLHDPALTRHFFAAPNSAASPAPLLVTAARTLAMLPTAEARQSLATLLSHSDPVVRRQAAVGLGRTLQGHRRAATALQNRLIALLKIPQAAHSIAHRLEAAALLEALSRTMRHRAPFARLVEAAAPLALPSALHTRCTRRMEVLEQCGNKPSCLAHRAQHPPWPQAERALLELCRQAHPSFELVPLLTRLAQRSDLHPELNRTVALCRRKHGS
jgi:hypothetical protein